MSIYTERELAQMAFMKANPTVVARVGAEIVRKVLRRRAYDIRSGEAATCIRNPFVRFDAHGFIAYQI